MMNMSVEVVSPWTIITDSRAGVSASRLNRSMLRPSPSSVEK